MGVELKLHPYIFMVKVNCPRIPQNSKHFEPTNATMD